MTAKLGSGNPKLGNVLTFSRTPLATCGGASDLCREKCYALKAYKQYKQTKARWDENALTDEIPVIPAGQKNLRIHVSGDFNTVPYIIGWYAALKARPDVTAWAYTRSWRMLELLPALEKLRSLPNVQLFASTDETISEPTPEGWRVAFIEGDDRQTGLTCPEQTKAKKNCKDCGYCFKGQKGNVRFLLH